MERILGIYGAGGLGREVLELALVANQASKKWDRFVFIVDRNVKAKEVLVRKNAGKDVFRH